MTKNALKVISDAMDSLNLNYGFGEYNGTISYPYFVGEYSEAESLNEDGLQESTFMIQGWSRNKWIDLENAKESIRAFFTDVGKTFMQTDGSCVVVCYGSSMIIPEDDPELKRMQINLIIKEWMVI